MRELLADKRAFASSLFLLLLCLGAASGQVVAGFGASASDWVWWMLSTRNVVWIVVSVLGVSLVLGSVAGALVAYGPRLFSGVLGRLVELSGALPSLIIVGLWRIRDTEPDIASFIAILAALKTIETARLVSSETERLSSQGFVVAAYALGASRQRVFVVHVLPHLLSALAVSSALTAASVVGLEAALSFVGLGLPGTSSWGALLGDAALGQTDWTTLSPQPAAAAPISATRIVLALLSVSATTLALYTLARAVAHRPALRTSRATPASARA